MKEELEALLAKLEIAFEKSNIKQTAEQSNYKWHYSLVTTTLQKGGPLILGFNWGATKNEKYEPQASIEKKVFKNEDVGSLIRIFPYCRKYFGDDFLERTSQSNYCFFRSQTESQIERKDIALCEPIFEKLIGVLEPSSILCFSSQLRDRMLENEIIKEVESIEILYKRGSAQVTYRPMRAKLLSGAKIVFLPHPNYPMTKLAREQAWDFCCGS